MTNSSSRHDIKAVYRMLQEEIPSASELHSKAGLVEALCLLLPERCGIELPEAAPHLRESPVLKQIYTDSVVWRSESTLNATSVAFIESYVGRFDYFCDQILLVVHKTGHPFNADYIHKRLIRMKMADRDALWSIYLYRSYERGYSTIANLVSWCIERCRSNVLDDQTILLIATALAWCFTTSHRFLRDRATKAIVNVMRERVDLLPSLIEKFQDVDDAYVKERLLAAAYGSALRSPCDAHIISLGRYVYNNIFNVEYPQPHLLIRDYARGIVEYALYKGLKLPGVLDKIRPPYSSYALEPIPEWQEIAENSNWIEHGADNWRRFYALKNSVAGSTVSDFSIYILAPTIQPFSKYCLGRNKPITPRRAYNLLKNKLTDEKRTQLRELASVVSQYNGMKRFGIDRFPDLQEKGYSEHDFDAAIQSAINDFQGQLTCEERELLTVSLPYLTESTSALEYDCFPLEKAKRWLVNRIFELGWLTDTHGEFDETVQDPGRAAHKPERIGKKYQWLAYHELLARLSDNYQLSEESFHHIDKYEFPGQFYLRDIDPTILISRSKSTSSCIEDCWWQGHNYAFREELDDLSWLQLMDDLPITPELLHISNPADGSQWFNAYSFFLWQQPTEPGQDRYDNISREVFLKISAYLVNSDDISKLLETAQKFEGVLDDLHGPRELSEVFLGEYYWSPIYKFHSDPYYGDSGWKSSIHDDIPIPGLRMAESFTQSASSYDCSIEDNIRILVPSAFLTENMNLRWKGIEGEYVAANNEVAFWDPSVFQRGPEILLGKRDLINELLHQGGYEIVWFLSGEKRQLGLGLDRDEYLGRLQISVMYYTAKGEIHLGMDGTTFTPPSDPH